MSQCICNPHAELIGAPRMPNCPVHGVTTSEPLCIELRMLQAQERITQLEAALREAGTDSERLDWLLSPIGKYWLTTEYIRCHSVSRSNIDSTREAIATTKNNVKDKNE